jgi:hypothetical protein
MKIEVSIGEIVDKLSILRIKKNNITDSDKLANVTKEYDYLYDIIFDELRVSEDDFLNLVSINEKLWDIEDLLRDKESIKSFDQDFIELARSVYYTNDKRAEIKKEINIKYGSLFVEEKSYKNYSDPKLSQGERIKWFVTNYYETGMEMESMLVSMKDTDLDNFVWYGEKITIPKSSLEAARMSK